MSDYESDDPYILLTDVEIVFHSLFQPSAFTKAKLEETGGAYNVKIALHENRPEVDMLLAKIKAAYGSKQYNLDALLSNSFSPVRFFTEKDLGDKNSETTAYILENFPQCYIINFKQPGNSRPPELRWKNNTGIDRENENDINKIKVPSMANCRKIWTIALIGEVKQYPETSQSTIPFGLRVHSVKFLEAREIELPKSEQLLEIEHQFFDIGTKPKAPPKPQRVTRTPSERGESVTIESTVHAPKRNYNEILGEEKDNDTVPF
ncbi:MAG: hypothetical protein ACRCX2_34740 [Paraclostridium sp.]